jgi:hypothetical protein
MTGLLPPGARISMVFTLQFPESRIYRIRIAILSVLTSVPDHVLFRQLLNRIIRLIRSTHSRLNVRLQRLAMKISLPNANPMICC